MWWTILRRFQNPCSTRALAYLTLSLMRDVINHGTAANVRGLGFSAPAAGKTGTSHDAWFAGFPSNLLCVIWIGNDDYTDVKLEGNRAAAPIWAEFMKNAVKLPQYSDTQYFDPPPGITEVTLDKATNLIADASCPRGLYRCIFSMARNPPGPVTIRTATSETSSKNIWLGRKRGTLRL